MTLCIYRTKVNCDLMDYLQSKMKIVIKTVNNVSWHDGTPFTAKDIQFTIDLLKNGDSVYKYNVDHIESAEVVDATTLKVKLNGNIPFFEYNLIFPIHIKGMVHIWRL